ncbi:MAG: type II toxin-antitoxin system HicA family toxin [Candidatus Riflebacteria bacterium]|nr:type II toxin-antitoxin system HicA family toxin [Candidatus Riflebacteria bacterium]
MPKLPVCSGHQAIRVFESFVWVVDRQRGSHVSMVKPGSFYVLTIPAHDTIDRGLYDLKFVRRESPSISSLMQW